MKSNPETPKSMPIVTEHVPEQLIACRECDMLHRRQALRSGQTARCARCDAVLYRNQPAGIQQAAALGLAALLLYGIANAFPFIAIEAQGQMREISLLTCVTELYRHHMPGLAAFTFAILLLAPLLRVAGLLYVLLPLCFARCLPQAATLCRLSERLRPWSMAEIHLLGTLVALIKLADMGNIILGAAFWGLAALVLTLTAAAAALDGDTLWNRLDQARPWPAR